ncbi:potassium channel family protein [Clostridium sp. Marseille-P2415]|uniref:potassium channel family protein n=1 Tax=Clostridium sp. Marseille-P2415 TaxID=1805471 RepID=UPI00098843F5|nr:NAD-binding protein [Clostridium sp. Marseille-P2415]
MLFLKTKTIIIAGASRFGAGLAGRLSGRNTRIVVIDLKEEAFRKLPEDFSGHQIVGDGTDTELLKQVGIEQAQIFIAATDEDNVNILAAQIASRIFKVPEVFLRLNDKDKEKLISGFNMKAICPFVLSVNEFDRLTEGEYQEAAGS